MRIFYLTFLSLVLIGCSSTENIAEQKATTPSKTTNSISLAQKQLLEIIKEQDHLFETYKEETSDKLQLSQMNTNYKKLVSKWQNYISQYPNDIDAIIIYGKFLRAVGEFTNAYAAFLEVDKIDPNIAVVKQQLATFEGDYGLYEKSLVNIKRAIELSPDESIYYYQLAELLCVFYKDFLLKEIYSKESINKTIEENFEKAISLAPYDVRLYWRYAQSFYQQSDANWQKALNAWEMLEPFVHMKIEKNNVAVNKARVLIELYRDKEALDILEDIDTPSLQQNKNRLIAIVNAHEEGDAQKLQSLKNEEKDSLDKEAKEKLQEANIENKGKDE